MWPGWGWRAVAAGWALVIAVSGVLPTQGAVHAVSAGHADLLTSAGHFIAYALLGFLLVVAAGGWAARARDCLVALALAAALGGAVELVQGPLPYRDLQLTDFLVDVAGAALAIVAFSAVARARRPRSRRG